MGAERWKLSSINPNDQAGGGGCLCSERKVEDQAGPYIVFYGQELVDGLSPHAVLCASCVPGICKAIESGETLAIGTENPDVGKPLEQDYEDVSYLKTGSAPSLADDEELSL